MFYLHSVERFIVLYVACCKLCCAFCILLQAYCAVRKLLQALLCYLAQKQTQCWQSPAQMLGEHADNRNDTVAERDIKSKF